MLLMIACHENSKEGGIHTNEKEKKTVKPKFYGYPDMPQDDSLITSIGAGKVILGANLNEIDHLYDSVQNIKVYMRGIEWPGKKIILNKEEWIIASSNNSIGLITTIKTNSKQFRSRNGSRIGMSLQELNYSDSLGIDKEEEAFILYPEGIEFKIDKSSENIFFGSKKPDVNTLSEKAIITEFLIRCGDC
jgi:hypothetical protein